MFSDLSGDSIFSSLFETTIGIFGGFCCPTVAENRGDFKAEVSVSSFALIFVIFMSYKELSFFVITNVLAKWLTDAPLMSGTPLSALLAFIFS